MTRNFFNDFIRSLFCSIDYFIYSSIEWVTQGIFDIASLRTNVTIVETVRTKIYIVLGIVMLFKISLSLINYMINPDQMSDKEKGASKLISRTVVMLVMLMLLPTIFDLLYRVQNVFLPVLPRLLLGKETTEVTDTVSDSSNAMAVTLLQAFFHPYYSEEDGEYYASIDGSEEITSLSEFVEHVNDGSSVSIPLLGTSAGYSYEYRFLLSTVVGIVVLVLLIGITIDVAIRLFKMLVLEMLAPIPIMSYIDPKSQKDGAFQNWLKELSKTFLDIFIKLGLVYLVLYFISELQGNTLFVTYEAAEGTTANVVSPVRLMYLKVFLIIGLLMFVKQASKFIKNILGIKDNKDGGSFLGNVVGGLAGFGSGAISGAISGRGLHGALTGGLAGMAAGYQGAASGKGSNAWKTAGDTALQARLGDKNAKSGVLASLQTKAANAQMKSQAAKLNLTDESLAAAKNNMLALQEQATQAEWNYRDLIARGPEAGETQDAYNARRTAAYNDWQAKVTDASGAERNYTKGKEAYEKNYGQEDKAYSRYANGTVHRATKRVGETVNKTTDKVYDTVSTSVGGSTIERRREERTQRTASHGGFDPEKKK